MWTKNKSGLRIDPWGTPHFLPDSLYSFSILKINLKLLKYGLKQSITVVSKPKIWLSRSMQNSVSFAELISLFFSVQVKSVAW